MDMLINGRRAASGLLALCFGCLGGCLMLKAGPAPDAGFIEHPERLAEWRERAPMNSIWFRDREQFYATRSRFKKIHFPPVRTDFLLERGWWDELNTVDREGYEADVRTMADYIRGAMEKAFREDPSRRFEVTDAPDAETIIYEIALTELVATKAHVNAIGTALGAFVPGGGLVKVTATGSIAVESRGIAADTGQLELAWKDREKDRASLFSLADFNWYSHARSAVDDWADQLVEAWNTPIDHKIDDSLPFTWRPW